MAKKKGVSKKLIKVAGNPRSVGGELFQKKESKKRVNPYAYSEKIDGVVGRNVKRTKITIEQPDNKLKGRKLWDYKTKPEQHFVAKVGCDMKKDAIAQIKSGLTQAQLQLFAGTCFGHFLNMSEMKFQAQLVHYLLLRELVQFREDEMWIGVNGVHLKFSVDEFALITGLKCVGECNKLSFAKESNTLLNKYFPGVEKINKQSIEELFLSKRWDSDGDAVKIAVLYFVHLYLFSSPRMNLVQKEDFDIIDSNDFGDYPWGKELFNFTLESLKNKVVGKRKQGESLYYRLLGYPIALQIWFYECCASASGKLCTSSGNGNVPRILKWESHTVPNLKFLKQFFVHKVNLKNIFPTHEEKEKLMLDGLFKKGKEIATDDEDDFLSPSVHRARARISSSFVPKSSRSVFDSDIMTELKLLSSKQDKLAVDFYAFKADMEGKMSNMFECLFELKKLLQTDGQKVGRQSSILHEEVEENVVKEKHNIDLEGVEEEDGDDRKDNDVGEGEFEERLHKKNDNEG